tara:strand:- start:6787 stop:8196 length:1410 start_codon:yes stop_codon:yes gene_type:complete
MKNNILKLFNSLVFKITVSFSVVLVGTLLSLGVYLQHVAKIESDNIQNEYNQLKVERIQRLIDSITTNQPVNLRDVQRRLMDYSKISGANIKLYDENNIEVFDTSKGLNINNNKRNPVFKVIPTSLGGMVVEVNQPNLVSIQAISASDTQEDQLIQTDPPISNIVNQIVKSIAIIGILSIMTSILIIWIISRRTLNPITNIVNTSKYLSKGDFTKRVDQSGSGELSEIVTAFNYMASELQKLDEQRKIMIADIAHELRTPMTNLKGYIEGWSDGIIKPDNETLQILDYQVNTLSKIIDDLSTLSLAESGMLNLNISEFDLNNKIFEIINNFKLRSKSKNINITNNIPSDITINYDAQRFTQIITNILNNSILATDDGGEISFSTSIRKKQLILEISDNGIGIPEKELPYIFDRFYRADKSRNRQSGGSGLGLSIVKFLIESHNGTIEINSELTKGTQVLIFINKYNTSL